MNITFQHSFQRAFGTFPLKGDELRQSVNTALEVGYRAFDTAQMYENEADTGQTLEASRIARDDLCITTKVHYNHFTPALFIPSVEKSLVDLKVDYVDVLLLHWPTPGGAIEQSLELLQEAHGKGLTRNIGVSNYTIKMMKQAAATVSVPIVTNQVEFHPLLDQSKLLAAASQIGIPLSSYCSVARGAILNYPLLGEIGATYEKTAAQVALRWILQKGVTINTMSTKPKNIRTNFNVMDFTLSSIDMARIDKLAADTNHRVVSKERVSIAPDFD